MLDKVTLLDRSTEVSLSQLAQAIVLAALLASEAAGTLKLEARTKKALFGLRTVETLYATPGPAPAQWPSGSFEARIAAALSSAKPLEVADVLYAVLGEDSSDPRHDIVRQTTVGLASRDLVSMTTEKRFKLFNVSNFALPESTDALAAQQPTAPVEDLLAACKQGRPQVWKLIADHIKSAISRRTESSDHDYSSD